MDLVPDDWGGMVVGEGWGEFVPVCSFQGSPLGILQSFSIPYTWPSHGSLHKAANPLLGWLGGGGGTQHSGTEWMDTYCQKAVLSKSCKHQNLGVVSSSGKKEGGGVKIQSKDLIEAVTCKMCLFSFHFVNSVIFILHEMLCGRIGVAFVYDFVLRIWKYEGRWSAIN